MRSPLEKRREYILGKRTHSREENASRGKLVVDTDDLHISSGPACLVLSPLRKEKRIHFREENALCGFKTIANTDDVHISSTHACLVSLTLEKEKSRNS